MTQHISVRVPWYDSGWNGCVCNELGYRNVCLKLKIYMKTVMTRNKCEQMLKNDIMRRSFNWIDVVIR